MNYFTEYDDFNLLDLLSKKERKAEEKIIRRTMKEKPYYVYYPVVLRHEGEGWHISYTSEEVMAKSEKEARRRFKRVCNEQRKILGDGYYNYPYEFRAITPMPDIMHITTDKNWLPFSFCPWNK